MNKVFPDRIKEIEKRILNHKDKPLLSLILFKFGTNLCQ